MSGFVGATGVRARRVWSTVQFANRGYCAR